MALFQTWYVYMKGVTYISLVQVSPVVENSNLAVTVNNTLVIILKHSV